MQNCTESAWLSKGVFACGAQSTTARPDESVGPEAFVEVQCSRSLIGSQAAFGRLWMPKSPDCGRPSTSAIRDDSQGSERLPESTGFAHTSLELAAPPHSHILDNEAASIPDGRGQDLP